MNEEPFDSDEFMENVMERVYEEYDEDDFDELDEDERMKIVLDTINDMAQDNDVDAQCFLGLCYLHGNEEFNFFPNATKAEKWLTRAGRRGSTYAQGMLGALYFSGNYGFDKDFEKAFDWYEMAAESEDAQAEFALGYLYANGLGVERDLDLAFEWAVKSASQGYTEAATLLTSIAGLQMLDDL